MRCATNCSLGRILFSLVFIGSGVGHLTQTASSAEYAAYKKVPSPKAMVQFTGVAMLLGGIAVILGIWMDLAASASPSSPSPPG
ncbi:MAG: DoxX family membrane protein [Ilumatobacteraceae bacterium]